jgi:hypothetical protein
LPPLAQPAPQQRKAAPGARPQAAPPPPAAAVPPPLPFYANPGFTLGSGGAGAGIQLARPPGLADCRPENYANLNPSDRKACSNPQDMARRDPNAMPLNPARPVQNAPIWQAEIDRRNAPAVIPGGNPLGALSTLLSNPGAFLDPRNYSYATPGNGGDDSFDGAEATHRAWSQAPQCPAGLDDTARRICLANAAAVYQLKFATGGAPGPAVPHASDTAFQKALAATQARTRSLYAAPVLASGASKGAGNAQIRGSDNNIGNGGAAAGGTGTSR